MTKEAQGYSAIGPSPAEVFVFGDLDRSLTNQQISGILGNPNFGDAEYSASQAWPIMDVNNLNRGEGGNGAYIQALSDRLYLPSANHPFTTGAMSLVSWFTIPNDRALTGSGYQNGIVGVDQDASNWSVIGYDSGFGLWAGITQDGAVNTLDPTFDETLFPDHMSDDNNNFSMMAMTREASGSFAFYACGVYQTVVGLPAYNLSTFDLLLGGGGPFAVHIETAVFDQVLTQSDLDAIWNQRQGTFGRL